MKTKHYIGRVTAIPSPFEIHSAFYRRMEKRARRRAFWQAVRRAASIFFVIVFVGCLVGLALYGLFGAGGGR
jgi:hypothetical protein